MLTVSKSLCQNEPGLCLRELPLEGVLWLQCAGVSKGTPLSLGRLAHTAEKSFKGSECRRGCGYSPALTQQKRSHPGRMPDKFHKFKGKTLFRGSNWLGIGEGKLCRQITWENLQGVVSSHWTSKNWSQGETLCTYWTWGSPLPGARPWYTLETSEIW